MAVTYYPNPAYLPALARSDRVRAILHHRAELVVIRAELLAHVRTGLYAFDADNPRYPDAVGGFRISTGVRAGVVYARVTAMAPYARHLEFGTRYMKRQRILGRALAAARIRS